MQHISICFSIFGWVIKLPGWVTSHLLLTRGWVRNFENSRALLKVKVKVTRSSIFVSFERASLVEFACQIWSLDLSVVSSDGGSVEFHNRSSVRIGWCIRCDFADYNRFSHIHWIKYFLCPGRKFRRICFFLCLCAKGNNWFSYITQGRTYCQLSRRLSVSKTSLPCGFVVHIHLVIACFVQASDDRLLKMRIDHHNQQLLRLINRLFPIIGTSLVVSFKSYSKG